MASDKKVKIVFAETLAASNDKLNRNNIAVQARIRPATMSDLANKKVASIRFDTLERMLAAMNELDDSKEYDINDIIRYE